MKDEEEKEIIKGLSTSPDFLAALSEGIDQVMGKTVTVEQFGLFFFSHGYLSCLDYQDKKGKLRPFKYEPPCK